MLTQEIARAVLPCLWLESADVGVGAADEDGDGLYAA